MQNENKTRRAPMGVGAFERRWWSCSEDRINQGSGRLRIGAAEGCTNEQDEHRSGQSDQAPRSSAVAENDRSGFAKNRAAESSQPPDDGEL